MSGPREVIRIFVKFLVLSDKLAATRGKEPVTEFIYIYIGSCRLSMISSLFAQVYFLTYTFFTMCPSSAFIFVRHSTYLPF